MKNAHLNTLVIVTLALIVVGVGYYMTEMHQPNKLEQLEKQDHEARLRHVRVESLLEEQAESSEQAQSVVQRWKARYKTVPAEMKTPDFVQHIENLTRSGFDAISINYITSRRTADISSHLFRISGTAFFRNLHQLVWHLENDREFYRVYDLNINHETVQDINDETGLTRQLDMVKFTMDVEAYYAGSRGLSPPTEDLADIPGSLLPRRTPAHNSFYPIVRTDLPPNDRGLVDVEAANLVSIVGDRAIFEDDRGRRQLREGDEVYLGRIVKIDPVAAIVRASLNKGGVLDIVERSLSTGERYRQAEGDVRLRPIEQ